MTAGARDAKHMARDVHQALLSIVKEVCRLKGKGRVVVVLKIEPEVLSDDTMLLL